LAVLVLSVTVGQLLAQQPTVQARAVRPASLTGDLLELDQALDGLPTTAARSGRAYTGQRIVIDIGSQQNVIGVNQDHGRWPTNRPAAYRIEVAENDSGPWMDVFAGDGQRGETKAIFEAVRARFIRVTATGDGPAPGTPPGLHNWSIAEIRAIVDPGAVARRIPVRPPGPPDRPETGPTPPQRVNFRDVELAFDRNPNTRATTGTPNYEGVSIIYDLGGEYELSRVIQMHGRWSDDYPGMYRIDVSRQRDESRFREVWQGRGEPGRSIATFTPVITRFVRLTALRQRDRIHPWSIAEIRTNRDPGAIDEDDGRLDREIRDAVGNGLANLNALLDANETNFASSGRGGYHGAFVTLDMGGSYTISKVVQVHEPNEQDFPDYYRIDVRSTDERWQMVFEGAGEAARSRATFNPVRARFVRITVLETRARPARWKLPRVRVAG
jgi:hypothetical protein